MGITENMPRRFGNVVTPIYAEQADGRIEHTGTGVLLQSNDGLWLFTAAHVLAQHSSTPILLPGKPFFFRLTTPVFSACELTPKATATHVADVAFVKLTEEQANWIFDSGHHFFAVTRESVDVSSREFYPGNCAVTGYPEHTVTIDHERRFAEIDPILLMSTFANPRRLLPIQHDPSLNLAVNYERRPMINGIKMVRPNPRGLSGGAIWLLENEKVYLVGIVTEFWKAQSLIIGTRIREITKAMAHFRDRLSET
jgi:hypothetical protein